LNRPFAWQIISFRYGIDYMFVSDVIASLITY
jgi:hypothetical protein